MKRTLEERLADIDWVSFETAYGPAHGVPDQLAALSSGNRDAARKASHDLWCGLCHQHAYVSSAALPALPFLLDALESATGDLAIEILDILLGFATCTRDAPAAGAEAWEGRLRQGLKDRIDVFRRFAAAPDEEIADFARTIMKSLGTAG